MKALETQIILRSKLVPIVIVCLILCGLILANYRYSNQVAGGEDFLIIWKGAQLFFKEGIDPYSAAGTKGIQEVLPNNFSSINNGQIQFLSPLYIVLFIFPTIFITNPALARAVWMCILEIALITQVILSIRLIDCKPAKSIFALLLVLSLFGYHSFEALVRGDQIILIALSITSAVLCVKLGWDELAGIIFAISTISLNAVLFILIFITYWSIKNGRQKIIIWFIIAMSFLLLTSILLMPTWPLSYLRTMVKFVSENHFSFLGNKISLFLPGMGIRMGWILTGATFILVIFEWWLSNRYGWRGFLWACMFTITSGLWLGAWIGANDLVLYMPVLVMLFSIWVDRWQRAGKWVVMVIIVTALLSGWILYLSPVGTYSLHNALVLTIVPILLMIFLYWGKWWAVQSTKTWLEAYYSQENPPKR